MKQSTSNSSKSDRLKNKIKMEMEERRKKQLAKKSKLEITKIKKQAKYVRKRGKVRSLHQYLNPKWNGSPHPLILIGAKQMENIKDNCIILTEMSRSNICRTNSSDGGQTCYTVKSMGINVKQIIKEGQKIVNISPENVTDGFVAILCEANSQCLHEDPSICFISADRDNDDVYEYALLMLYITNIDIGVNDVTGSKWVPIHVWDNEKDYIKLKKMKKSTIKRNKATHHYGSTGECFSFGLRNDFKKSECQRISLTQYASDNNGSDSSQFIQYIGDYFENCYRSFNKIIPGLSNFINVTCRFMKYKSKQTDLKHYVTTLFKDDIKDQSKCFMLSGNININAKTRDLHCEKDTTYTTICVPKQSLIHAYVVFEFMINDSMTLQLDVQQNSAFVYSAYCLSHRQLCTMGKNCMNISNYSARSVFNHFKKSLERVQTDA
jgi:hypothetical protein